MEHFVLNFINLLCISGDTLRSVWNTVLTLSL
nr:MAG TPA: hypothetical protein [Bacteriophage sp.]